MEAVKMRAKVRVGAIHPMGEQEAVTFFGVAKSGGYPADGSDEDNSFARWSPSVKFEMTIANPNLVGSFKIGETFYCDFIPAPS